ncbi:MAG: hypothetical protein JWL64_1159 [Frankiales bacterium]|nr:hypothetical protein [Frankiales bacterium]
MPLLLLSKTFRRIVGGLVLAVFLLIIGTAGRVWWVARQDDRRTSDAIVVLGASQYNGRPSEIFAARLDHAVALFRAGVAPRVITVGGGQPGDRYTEAAAGKTYLAAHGVTQVVSVEEGRDTLSSMKALDRTMSTRGWRSAVLVTDPWHSMRARRMASDQGIDAVTSPTRTGPSVHERGTEARYIARETAGYLYYRVFGRSRNSGPDAL